MLQQTPKNFRKKFLQKLGDAWDKNPELQFTQLIAYITKSKESVPEIYFLNNDIMMNKLNDWLNGDVSKKKSIKI